NACFVGCRTSAVPFQVSLGRPIRKVYLVFTGQEADMECEAIHLGLARRALSANKPATRGRYPHQQAKIAFWCRTLASTYSESGILDERGRRHARHALSSLLLPSARTASAAQNRYPRRHHRPTPRASTRRDRERIADLYPLRALLEHAQGRRGAD